MPVENELAEAKIYSTLHVKRRIIYSEYLERDVTVDVYIPNEILSKEDVRLLLINDGQDLETMEFAKIADQLLVSKEIEPVVFVGIHCGADRLNEYGTVCSPDYKGRGARAGLYAKFVFDELLPVLQQECKVDQFKEKSFAGFSLGALSAIDIVWNYPEHFAKVGVFSGALWWRRRGYEDVNYNWDKDRLMHLQVQKGVCKPWLKFFFECGKLDETADRNNNGIIDSIEDTTDLIEDLKEIGYKGEDIYYLELEDGEHNVETWGRAFPAFLKWGWAK